MKTNSNITQELLESIERYYNDTMPIDERKRFEKQLQDNPEFNIQVEDIKNLLLGIETQSLKEKLDEFHSDMPKTLTKEEPSSKVRFLHFRKIAAAAIVVIALGSYWLFSGSSNERLYASYFSPDPGLPTTMSSTDNFAFFDAMVNYKQGDYQKAIDKWEVLHDASPINDTINYFLGVSNLAANKPDKAITYLEKTVSQHNSIFNEDAHYYLGLAFLKDNEKEMAIKHFKLSNNENSKELLEKLD